MVTLFSYINCQDSAVSAYIHGKDGGQKGDIITRTVRVTNTTPATYYCTLMFNSGAELGGYTGIQDSPDKGHCHVFSLWNSKRTTSKITPSFTGPGTHVEPFGGEGEGTKSMNTQFGWTLNVWQTLVLRRWDANGITRVGWWVHDEGKSQWIHVVTLDYPVASVYFSSGTDAFLEDWLSTGDKMRRVEFKNTFKRNSDTMAWTPLSSVNYNANESDRGANGRSRNYKDAYDAGVSNGAFYMQAGGSTRNTCRFNGSECPLNVSSPSQPTFPAINFSVHSVNANQISWHVPQNSTPQFKYTVKVNGKTYDVTDAEARSMNFNPPVQNGANVQITLEDIYGNTKSITRLVGMANQEKKCTCKDKKKKK